MGQRELQKNKMRLLKRHFKDIMLQLNALKTISALCSNNKEAQDAFLTCQFEETLIRLIENGGESGEKVIQLWACHCLRVLLIGNANDTVLNGDRTL